VTRGEEPDGPLTRNLLERGARVLQWGSIAFTPPEDPAPFLGALEELEAYDWICFSSPRGADAVVSRVPAVPPGVRVAAVGPSTAESLLRAGWRVDRVGVEPSGAGLVEAFRSAGDAAGKRVLFPASAVAREEIPAGLAALGAIVHQVTAYRMVTPPLDAEECADAVRRGWVQAVTFASPSAMNGLRTVLGEDIFRRLAAEIPAAAMGPTTAAALRKAGWERVTVAREATLTGLADAALKAAGG
jgi:uroporphyrinogen-III synthase